MDILKLPSAFQHEQNVSITFFFPECRIFGIIKGVHFYGGKVKYDIELQGNEGSTTRIYNVDSAFVGKPDIEEEQDERESFRIASLSLRKYLERNYDAHTTVIVTSEAAILMSGDIVVNSLISQE